VRFLNDFGHLTRTQHPRLIHDHNIAATQPLAPMAATVIVMTLSF
jgi:hypothetical protein